MSSESWAPPKDGILPSGEWWKMKNLLRGWVRGHEEQWKTKNASPKAEAGSNSGTSTKCQDRNLHSPCWPHRISESLQLNDCACYSLFQMGIFIVVILSLFYVYNHIYIYNPNKLVFLVRKEWPGMTFALEDCTSPGDSRLWVRGGVWMRLCLPPFGEVTKVLCVESKGMFKTQGCQRLASCSQISILLGKQLDITPQPFHSGAGWLVSAHGIAGGSAVHHSQVAPHMILSPFVFWPLLRVRQKP